MKKVVLSIANESTGNNTFDVDGIRHGLNYNDIVLCFFGINEEQRKDLFWYAVCNEIDMEQTKEDFYFIVKVNQIESVTNI